MPDSKTKYCAYCGKTGKLTKDHVVPRCLYPSSQINSRIQRITVPACSVCNNSWSNDEPHFRNIILIAGKPNSVVEEIWTKKAFPSFRLDDGKHRLHDVYIRMVAVQTSEGLRHKVFPANDKCVMRIIRKIIRGLSHFHGFPSPVVNDLVWCDVLRYRIPQEFYDHMTKGNTDDNVFKYSYDVLNIDEIFSVWLLTFYERTKFFGFVYQSRDAVEHAMQKKD